MSNHSQSSSSCVFCGNNPVDHRSTYLTESVTARVVSFGAGWSLGPLEPLAGIFAHTMMRSYFGIFALVRMVEFRDSIDPCSDRSRVIWEEALRRGLRIEQAMILGKPSEYFRVRVRGQWYYFLSIPIPPSLTRSNAWMMSKAALKEFLVGRGIRVPRGGRARSLREAERIFDAVAKPVIVKPEIGSRGRHTVTNIRTKEELHQFFPVAQTLCEGVVVEEYLVGSVYRATYVNGEIVGVLRGDPPRVTGDGKHTVRELIVRKNSEKHVRQKEFVVLPTTEHFLGRSGYTLDSVVDQGVTVDLSEKIGLSYGGFAAEMLPEVHPNLRSALTRAGEALGFPIIGFDFISADVTRDPDTVAWGIIESNTLPFIDLHHVPVEGPSLNVAGKIWDMWGLR